MSDRRDDTNHDREDGSPEEIESRIRSTQEHLRNDLDALESKVSPDALKRQAEARVDEATDMIKEKAVDTTRQVGEAVRHRIDDMTEGFRRGDRMSTLSVLGLVAVIGIGLLLTREPQHRDRYRDPYRARAYTGPRGRMDEGAGSAYGGYAEPGGHDDRGGRVATYPQRT